LYEKSRHLIQADELLVVLARIAQDDYSGGMRVHADRILDLAGARAEFARALGLEADFSERGLGLRSQRYAMIVEDGTVTGLFVEAPGAYEVSAAEAVLANL
ncbi:MAG: redoxin family protein, partial [Alphaproteobacteria bacterium]|nr:redoxin family protein [Alphaproteobacteria bacterium]